MDKNNTNNNIEGKEGKNFMWYIINTFPGSEYTTAENIKKAIENNGFSEFLSKIIIPSQTKISKSKKAGVSKQKTSVKILYPGYIFVKMVINKEVLSVIRYVDGVRNIGGTSNNSDPLPVSREEMESVFKRMGEIHSSMYLNYKIGDLVRVVNGPLKGNSGKILSINTNTAICEIEMVFFGKLIPASVNFADIEKDNIKKIKN